MSRKRWPVSLHISPLYLIQPNASAMPCNPIRGTISIKGSGAISRNFFQIAVVLQTQKIPYITYIFVDIYIYMYIHDVYVDRQINKYTAVISLGILFCFYYNIAIRNL